MTNVVFDTSGFNANLKSLQRRIKTSGVEVVRKDTTALANNVKANIMNRSASGGFKLASSVSTTFDMKDGVVAVNASYAPYVEYGTSKMKGKHFMRDAIEYIKPKFVEDIRRLIK